jgi:hypothetical protein
MHPTAGRATAPTSMEPLTAEDTGKSRVVAVGDSVASENDMAWFPAVSRTDSSPVTDCALVS